MDGRHARILVACSTIFFGCAVTAPPREELMQLERDWSAAFLRHDTTTIARLLADDYVGTDGRAYLSDKARELEEARVPEPGEPLPGFVILEEKISDMSVRLYGDTAIVNGLCTERVRSRGAELELRYRRTTVWLMRDARWQCVSFHASRLDE
jgi:ketosteroid isomerase-like protein